MVWTKGYNSRKSGFWKIHWNFLQNNFCLEDARKSYPSSFYMSILGNQKLCDERDSMHFAGSNELHWSSLLFFMSNDAKKITQGFIAEPVKTITAPTAFHLTEYSSSKETLSMKFIIVEITKETIPCYQRHDNLGNSAVRSKFDLTHSVGIYIWIFQHLHFSYKAKKWKVNMNTAALS